jgi:hypothetical protein
MEEGIVTCDEGKIKPTLIKIKEKKGGVEIFIKEGDSKVLEKCLRVACKHCNIHFGNGLRGYQ